MSQPTAVVELKIREDGGSSSETVQFEMDGAKLREVLAEVDAIEKLVKSM